MAALAFGGRSATIPATGAAPITGPCTDKGHGWVGTRELTKSSSANTYDIAPANCRPLYNSEGYLCSNCMAAAYENSMHGAEELDVMSPRLAEELDIQSPSHHVHDAEELDG